MKFEFKLRNQCFVQPEPPGPSDDGGGGGGGPTGPYFSISPSGNVNFGSTLNGTSVVQNYTIYNLGDLALSINSIVSSLAQFVVSGIVTPISIPGGGTATFAVTFTPNVAGPFAATLTISYSATAIPASPFVSNLSGTGVAAGVGICTYDQAAYTFPNVQKVGTVSGTIPVLITNTGTAAFDINNILIAVGADFTLSGLPAFPYTVNPAASVGFNVAFSPVSAVGPLAGLIRAVTTLATANQDVAVQGTAVLLIPVAIVTNTVRALVFGFNDINLANPVHKQLSSLDLNNDQAGTLIFNGAIWEMGGQEKTVERLEVFYENYGVFTLTFTFKCLRPSMGADSFDIVTNTVQLGTAAADGTERSQFVDLTASGEILELTVTRGASGGYVSLIAIIPQFAERGEKVENV
jgi:hypothetical protein